jgi:putative membrane protein
MKVRRKTGVIGLGVLALALPVFAHTGALPDPGRPWWTHWNPDALIIANLFFLVACYVSGLRQMRSQRGPEAPVRPWQVVAFGAGIVCLIVALLSPVDVLAGELLWVHMVQHMTLMNLAAPLVVLGAPVRTILWALPPSARGRIGRWRQKFGRRGIPRYVFWQPVFLWTLYAFVLWVWHLPVLYEAALRYGWVHDAQHLIFFGASCLFWRVMFDPIGRLRLSQGGAVLYLFATSLHATMLGVFMALAPGVWYETYATRAPAWGLAALEDQQLAGYIMWMPACMIYALVAAIVFALWLREGAEKGDAGCQAPRNASPVPFERKGV